MVNIFDIAISPEWTVQFLITAFFLPSRVFLGISTFFFYDFRIFRSKNVFSIFLIFASAVVLLVLRAGGPQDLL